MNLKAIQFAFAALLMSLGASAQPWHEQTMPVTDIRPGMRGYLKTVFYGDTVERVDVEIIDVMRNYYPRRDVILARLLGSKAEQAGVVSGMSGSPVYIDGRLVGALAYRFGEFLKEPIAGITPIGEMSEIVRYEAERDEAAPRSAALLPEFLRAAAVGVDSDFWTRLLAQPAETPVALQKITCPLYFSGFGPTVEQLRPLFADLGFAATAGGGSFAAKKASFEPGSAVSIVFMTGDYTIEAIGTVTAVEGNRLLAFGHSLFNLGPISLPLAGAQVYATLPSLMASSKMGAAGEVVGVFRQDRSTGALGDLSVMPKMIPITLTVESPTGEAQRFKFSLADDPAFNNILPFFLRTAVIQGAVAGRLGGEQNSCRLSGAIRLSDGRSVTFDDFFSSRQRLGFLAAGADAVDAADLAATALGTLMVHNFEGPQVSDIELHLKTARGENYASIESVQMNKNVFEAGDTLDVTVVLRDNRDRRITVRRRLPLPAEPSAERLSLIAASGSSLSNYEMQVSRSRFVPRSFDHLLQLINSRRKPQMLYLQLRSDEGGVLVQGKELRDLPPSVRAQLNSRSTRGAAEALREGALHEEAVPCSLVVLGSRRLTLQIKPPAAARTVYGKSQFAQ